MAASILIASATSPTALRVKRKRKPCSTNKRRVKKSRKANQKKRNQKKNRSHRNLTPFSEVRGELSQQSPLCLLRGSFRLLLTVSRRADSTEHVCYHPRENL